jgi:ribonuclease HII
MGRPPGKNPAAEGAHVTAQRPPRIPPGRKLWAHDREQALAYPVLCGVDEVGRGPLAGNVVAACVILDLDRRPLDALNDSKQVPAPKREELFREIKEAALGYGLGECSPEEIDRFNILGASLLAMRRALEAMAKETSLILVDGNQAIPDLGRTQRCLVKGDGLSASIAAASILAKVTRDRQMDDLHRLYPQYGFDAHKGYPTRAHLSALDRHGLTPAHRRSFCLARIQQVDLFGS